MGKKMTTQYAVIPFVFDSALFAQVLTDLSPDMLEDVRLLLDVSPGCIWNWKNNRHTAGAPYPNMTNFIALCNLLDLDPRNFFRLA